MTWVPCESFDDIAKVLDRRLLQRQRYDAWRIFRLLTSLATGSEPLLTLPVVKMWTGYEPWLVGYGNAICSEYERRTGEDTELGSLFKAAAQSVEITRMTYPSWLSEPLVHLSHRSNLIKLDPEWYGPLWPGVPEGLPLVWPKTR